MVSFCTQHLCENRYGLATEKIIIDRGHYYVKNVTSRTSLGLDGAFDGQNLRVTGGLGGRKICIQKSKSPSNCGL